MLRTCWQRYARHGWLACLPRDRKGRRKLSWRRRAPPGICRHRLMASSTTTTPRPPTWMRPAELVAEVTKHSSDPGRQGQKFGLHDALAFAAQAGPSDLHHWCGSVEDRVALAWCGADSFVRKHLQRGKRSGKMPRAPGEVVLLLAPACSSFDQFENYEERGRVFKQLVADHKDWKPRQDE